MFKNKTGVLKNIKISDIFPDEKIPKRYIDENELVKLKENIKENGIITPLLVRRRGAGYVLISGERRLRAAKMAGIKKVPCLIYKTDSANSAIYTVSENLSHKPLNFFEEAERIRRIITEYGVHHSEIAARLGVSQSFLANKLRLLKLDEKLRKRIIAAALTERQATALLRINDSARSDALDYIIINALGSADTELYIDSLIRQSSKENPVDKKTAIGDIRIFANSLSRLVDTLVSSGIEARQDKKEFRDHVEYRIKIPKNTEATETAQLKIC